MLSRGIQYPPRRPPITPLYTPTSLVHRRPSVAYSASPSQPRTAKPRTKQEFFRDVQSDNPFTGIWLNESGTLAVMLSRPCGPGTDATGIVDWFSYDIVASDPTLTVRVDVASSHWPAFQAHWESRYSSLTTEGIVASESPDVYHDVQAALDHWQDRTKTGPVDDITRGDDLFPASNTRSSSTATSIWASGPLGSEFLPCDMPTMLFLDETTRRDPDMPYAIEVVARSEHKRRRHACTALQHVDVIHIYPDAESYEQSDPLVTHRLSSFFQRYHELLAKCGGGV